MISWMLHKLLWIVVLLYGLSVLMPLFPVGLVVLIAIWFRTSVRARWPEKEEVRCSQQS